MLNVFRQKQNLSTLWEVLIEEKNIKIENQKELAVIQEVFETNIEVFCKENSDLFQTQNLININKQFIKYIDYPSCINCIHLLIESILFFYL